jgi:nucleoside-diphosphate-sugar epimerase
VIEEYSSKIAIVGGNGILGSAITTKFAPFQLHLIERSIATKWCFKGSTKEIKDYLQDNNEIRLVINAAGLTNPRSSVDELDRINFRLPRELFEATNDLGIRLITLGTVMEIHPKVSNINPYVKSKLDFFNFIQNAPQHYSHLHLQLHTIYGGNNAHPHMFIEQMKNAIQLKNDFRMSSGNQVREYHHIDDEIGSIVPLMLSQAKGHFDLSVGNSVKLSELAIHVFSFFDLINHLKFDASLDMQDVREFTYGTSPLLDKVKYRNPLIGVTSYIETAMKCL